MDTRLSTITILEVPISEISEENYKVPSPELNTYIPTNGSKLACIMLVMFKMMQKLSSTGINLNYNR